MLEDIGPQVFSRSGMFAMMTATQEQCKEHSLQRLSAHTVLSPPRGGGEEAEGKWRGEEERENGSGEGVCGVVGGRGWEGSGVGVVVKVGGVCVRRDGGEERWGVGRGEEGREVVVGVVVVCEHEPRNLT